MLTIKAIWSSQNDLTNASERRAMYGRWAIDNTVRLIDESVGPIYDSAGNVSIHGNRHSARLRAARSTGWIYR